MGDVYDPGRRFCVGTLHTFPVYLFGLLLLASLPVVSSAKPIRRNLPQFLDTPNNITAVIGSDVVLPCSVAHLGTKLVIWKKVSRSSPITVGDTTFSPETRFKILRTDPYMSREEYERYRQGAVENPRWNLQIGNVRMKDAGVYECQLNTVMDINRSVTLHVVEDKSRRHPSTKTGIKLNGTEFVEKGSTIDLNCTATSIDYRPEGVDWFKDGSRIKPGGRTLINEYLESDTKILHSRLEIRRANMDDAGTYVCRFSQSHVKSVKVMVLNTDSSNKRRGTDMEGNGSRHSQTSQTSFPKGNGVRTYHYQHTESSNDNNGGSGGHPTSQLQAVCLGLVLVITHIVARTAAII